MRRFVVAMAGVAAMGVAANAADLPVKAPLMAPPPSYFSWTGCYLGGDVGYAWARDRDSEITTATGAPSPFSPASAASVTGPKLGGYLGCNYQISQFVLGLEGDGEWANLKGSTTFVTPAPSDFYETTIRWQASVRGRIGYAFDHALLYVTGGAAFANINEHDQVGATGASTDNSTTRTGWTVGAGVDYAFTSNWIGRIEYRYADFGTFSYVPAVFPAFTENHKLTEHAIRIGLAYKF